MLKNERIECIPVFSDIAMIGAGTGSAGFIALAYRLAFLFAVASQLFHPYS
ncbi:MAG: hypothetical protein AAE985_06965 [Thermoplasmataceae archaeon]